LPATLPESLKSEGMIPETRAESPFIAYLPRDKADVLPAITTDEAFKLFRTKYPVDPQGNYYGILATVKKPSLTLDDIHKTLVKGKSVEIHFNLEGTRKWAEMTRLSVGQHVAFVVDDLACDIPMIAGEIRNGAARIGGIPDQADAENLSALLNANRGN
jgi:preprotein translocase subunit SecD